MQQITVERMIQACRIAPNKKERYKLFDSFRMMRFYELMDEETFESFCESWKELELYK